MSGWIAELHLKKLLLINKSNIHFYSKTYARLFILSGFVLYDLQQNREFAFYDLNRPYATEKWVILLVPAAFLFI